MIDMDVRAFIFPRHKEEHKDERGKNKSKLLIAG
jgi:hypothetical protein